MSEGLFRKEAMKKASSPEQLDTLVHVTSVGGWIALAGVGVLVIAALAWGFFGRMETKVPGAGVLGRSPNANGVPREAVLYVPADLGVQIRPGMAVELLPVSYTSQLHGYIEGRVLSVAGKPVLPSTLPGGAETAMIPAGAPVTGVKVGLLSNPRAPNELLWSLAGPLAPVTAGTPVTGNVIVKSEHPVQLLIPVQ